MFDDFSKDDANKQSRKRFRNSMAVAFVVYASSGAAVVAATNKVRAVIEEELTQVEFAPPPEPEPPPPEPEPEPEAPKPKPQAKPRPKVKRPELAPPKEVSKEKLKESDGPLAEAGDTGPVDGFLDGVEGGTGTARAPAPPPPPPKPEPVVRPRSYPGNERPKYSKSALRRGIAGTVVVSFDVLEDGRVANPKIVSGPEEFHEDVLERVVKWRYHPATRGGKPIRMRIQKSIVFRLEDA